MALTTAALVVTPLRRRICVRAPFTTSDAAAGNTATVQWKRSADSEWIEGPPMVKDVRATLSAAAGTANPYVNQFRVTVQWLLPGVTYDIRVTFAGTVTGTNPQQSLNVTTLAEAPTLPTALILYVDAAGGLDSDSGLTPLLAKQTINGAIAAASGPTQIRVFPTGTYQGSGVAVVTVNKADIAIVGFSGTPVIDGQDARQGIYIASSGCIVQNIEVKRTQYSGIGVGAANAWIDDCYIHDWNMGNGNDQWRAGITNGSDGSDGGEGYSTMVVSNSTLTRRVEGGAQPVNGDGIWVKRTVTPAIGSISIFNNVFDGGFDCIGGESNFGNSGCVFGPYIDSEIYGNTAENADDDVFEIEGANVNVSVVGNTINYSVNALVGFNATVIGPIYFMRNRGRFSATQSSGYFYKAGHLSDGFVYLYHESYYCPLPSLETFTKVFIYDATSYIDETVDAASAATADVPLLQTDSFTQGDYIYIGSTKKFEEVHFTLSTSGVGVTVAGSVAGKVQVSTPTSWSDQTIGSDTTNNLSQSGYIRVPVSASTWQPQSVNGSASLYWWRIRTTTNPSVAPVASKLELRKEGSDGFSQTDGGFGNLVARNNAWQSDRYVINSTSVQAGTTDDIDYDALYTTDTTRFVKWHNTNRANLAAFQSSDGQELNGLSSDLTAAWTDPANGDFTPIQGQALNNAGVIIQGINSRDLDDPAGRYQGTTPDIGAIELPESITVSATVNNTTPTVHDASVFTAAKISVLAGAIEATVTVYTPTILGPLEVVAPVIITSPTVHDATVPTTGSEGWRRARKHGLANLLHVG